MSHGGDGYVSGSAGASACLESSARGVLGGLLGVPRCHHRQRGLPLDQGVVPGHVHRGAVLDPQRLQHRLCRLAHRLWAPHRPAGTAPGLRRRSGAVHRCFGAVRCSPVRGTARGRSGVAGPRRRPPRAGIAGARRRGFPRGEASACHWTVGSVSGGRRGAGTSDGRSAGPAGRLALGVPGESAVRGRGPVGGTQSAGGESGAGSSCLAGPPRRRPARRLPGRAQPRHREEQRLGLGQRRCHRRVRRNGAAAGLVRAQFAGPPCPAAGPGAPADPLLHHRLDRDRSGRYGVLRLPAHQHPVAAIRLGVRRPACRTRSGAGRAGRGRRRGTVGTTGRPPWLPRVRRSGRPGVGRCLSLVPPAGGAGACVLDRVVPRTGAQRHRGGGDPAAPGQRRAGGGAGRPLRHGFCGRVERPPTGRGAGHCGAGPDPR